MYDDCVAKSVECFFYFQADELKRLSSLLSILNKMCCFNTIFDILKYLFHWFCSHLLFYSTVCILASTVHSYLICHPALRWMPSFPSCLISSALLLAIYMTQCSGGTQAAGLFHHHLSDDCYSLLYE